MLNHAMAEIIWWATNKGKHNLYHFAQLPFYRYPAYQWDSSKEKGTELTAVGFQFVVHDAFHRQRNIDAQCTLASLKFTHKA